MFTIVINGIQTLFKFIITEIDII